MLKGGFSADKNSLLKCRKFPVLREFRLARQILLLFAALRDEQDQRLGPDLFRFGTRARAKGCKAAADSRRPL